MRENTIIAGLDIGTTEIRLAVGQVVEAVDGEKLQIIGAVSVPSEGITRGVVNSIEDVTSSISACLEKAERLVGLPIQNAWVSINGPYIKCERSKGVVAVSKSNEEITKEDIDRAVEAARALSVPPNYEILHVLPIRYTVDNQENVKDPIGMIGVRLEVETLIIQGLSSQINNLTKAIHRTGLDIDDLVLSPLSAAEAVIGSKQKELGAALVNIGSATTSLAVFEEGELLHTAVIPIGSMHITGDLAIGLRCPFNLAERIKIEFGSASSAKFDEKDEVDISQLAREEDAPDEARRVSRKEIAMMIEARVEEIFEKVDKELKKIDRSGMLPAGVFLIGGGAKLTDMVETAKRSLRLPASLGVNKNTMTVIDKVNDLAYLNSLGLVLWGYQLMRSDGSGPRKDLLRNANQILDGLGGKLKKLISSFKP